MTAAASRISLPVLLALCLLLGGASNGGFEANFLLQVLAVIVAVLAASTSQSSARANCDRYICWLVLLWLAIVGIQFVPMPPSIWGALPGRTLIATENASLGAPAQWGFITLSLYGSLASLTWALPAVCLAFALSVSESCEERALAMAIVGCTILAIGVGLAQILGASDSAAYLYDITNRGLMVGFFANANHMATLLLVALPFLTALIRPETDRKPDKDSELVVLWIVLTGFIFLAILLVGSLTGYALALPVFAMCCVMMFPAARRLLRYVFMSAVLAGVAVIAFANEGGNVFDEESALSQGGRQQIFGLTLQAAADFFPVGSGLGTFHDIFDDYEARDAVSNVYVNHAHSDYLEILLELGLAGAIGILLFLAWWAWKVRAVVLTAGNDYMAQAAAIASGVVLVHSLWDYPLRTAALSAIFAFCCVVLARTGTREDAKRTGVKRRLRQR